MNGSPPIQPTDPAVERLGHRLRAVTNGVVVIDSLEAVVITAPGTTPRYLVPRVDVRASLLDESAITGADRVPGYVTVAWQAAERWYAEDDEVVGHARDPRHRADALRSSRLVRVVVGASVVAVSERPVVLVETDTRPRYFLPRVDVVAALRRSRTTTSSPYLGLATHWSMTLDGEPCDVAVSYDAPQPGVAILEHLIAFDDRIASIDVSGAHPEGNGHGDPG